MNTHSTRMMNGKTMRLEQQDADGVDLPPASAAEMLRKCNARLDGRGLLQPRSFCFGSFHKKKQEGKK